MGLEDVVITVAMEFQAAQAAKIKKQVQDVANSIGDAIQKSMSGSSMSSSALLADINKLKKPMKSFGDAIVPAMTKSMNQLDNEFRASHKQMEYARTSIKSIDDVMADLDKQTKKNKVEFAGWAMSIMFFGMALKRTFDTIWKSSTKTFNDVMHSVSGSVTSFDMLDGSLKYLGFSVGQALEPVVMYLIPIIDKISAWVNENQKLTAGIVIALGVFGTFFSVLGSGVLAFNGFKEAAILLGPALKGIGAALSGLSLPVVLTVIAAIAAAMLIWNNNIGDIQGIAWDLLDIFGTSFASIIDDLKLTFSGLWEFLNGLFTGDFQLVIDGFGKMWKGVGGLIETVMLTAATVTWNLFAGLVNLIKDLFVNLAKLMVDAIITGIDKMMPFVNRVLKALGKDPIEWDLEEQRKKLEEITNDFKEFTDLPTVSGAEFKAMLDENRLAKMAASGENFSSDPSLMYTPTGISQNTQTGAIEYTFMINAQNSVITSEDALTDWMGNIIQQSMDSINKGS